MPMKIRKILKSKRGEGYVDTGVKILIAVVLGALILTLLYGLLNATVMPSVKAKVESLFNYSGTGGSGGGQVATKEIKFTVDGFGEFTVHEGDTFGDWLEATKTGEGTNNIVSRSPYDSTAYDTKLEQILVNSETFEWATWDMIIKDGDEFFFIA